MKINREKLLEALERVKPATGTDIIDQSNTFVFEEGKVVTYNDEISISHPIEVEFFEGSIPAEELYNLLKRFKGDEVEVSTKDGELLLKSGRAKAGLRMDDEITLPLEEISESNKWHKLPGDFEQFMRFAMGACSRDMMRPILSCVHVNKDGRIEASDSYRLVQCKLDKMPVNTFLIPANSVKEVLKIQPNKISESKGWIHFINKEGTTISCRTYDDDYVNIQDHMTFRGEKVTLPEEMREAVERAKTFADEFVEITMNKSGVTVGGKSDVGWFEQTVKSDFKGEEEIKFHIRYFVMLDILKQTTECIIGKSKLKFKGDGWQYVAVIVV